LVEQSIQGKYKRATWTVRMVALNVSGLRRFKCYRAGDAIVA
jgi:hypothetical protein